MNEQQQRALESFSKKFLGFEIDAIEIEAERMSAAGVTIRQFLDVCMPAMAVIGERFEKGEYYLPHLVMAGEMFKKTKEKLRGAMDPNGGSSDSIAEIVLGTPKGDIHDLGKDIFAVLAEASGFVVHNLGVDVEPQMFIAKLQETGAQVLGISSLLTTTFKAVEEIVGLLEKKGLRGRTHVILGGGATEKSLVEKLGVDSQTRDAYEGIGIIKKALGVQGKSEVA